MSAIAPPRPQAVRISGVVCARAATTDGLTKMPVPMMPPITMSVASNALSSRAKRGWSVTFTGGSFARLGNLYYPDHRHHAVVFVEEHMAVEHERALGHVTKVENYLGDAGLNQRIVRIAPVGQKRTDGNERRVDGDRNARGARLLHVRHLVDVKHVRFHRRVNEIPLLDTARSHDDVGVRRCRATRRVDGPKRMLVKPVVGRVGDVVAVVLQIFPDFGNAYSVNVIARRRTSDGLARAKATSFVAGISDLTTGLGVKATVSAAAPGTPWIRSTS